MALVIAQKVIERDRNGQPISYRTRYYRWVDERGKVSLEPKASAVRLVAPTAQVVVRQLSQLYPGASWEVRDESMRTPQDRSVLA